MFKTIFVFLSVFFTLFLSACSADDNVFSIQLNTDETITDIILKDQNGDLIDYQLDNISISDLSLEGITEIHISHDEYEFDPSIITLSHLTSTELIIDVTKISDEVDEEPNENPDDEPDDTPIVRSEIVEVYSELELQNAIDNESTQTIILRNDFEIDVLLDAPIHFNLNGSTLTGSLTIDFNDDFEMTISQGEIDGDLIVNALNLTLTNYADVSGDIIINEISNETFISNGLAENIYVYADLSSLIINTKTASIFIDAVDVKVEVNNEVTSFTVLEKAEDITVINAAFILDAVINSSTVLLDELPTSLSGSEIPMFTRPILLDILYDDQRSFDHGLTVYEIMDLLPEQVEIVTTDDQFFVDVLVYTIHQNNYDPTDLNSQKVEASGILDLPEELINLYQLELIFDITILSFEDSNDGIVSYETVDSIEIPYGATQTLEDVISYLPSTVNVLTETTEMLNLEVQWSLTNGTFDANVSSEQLLTFTGNLNVIPDGYHNLNEISPEVFVTILENTETLVEPYGRFHIQATIDEAVQIDVNEVQEGGGSYFTITLTVDPNYEYKHMYLYQNEYIFTDKLTYTQYVSSAGSFHVVVVVEEIVRMDLSEAFASGNGSEENPLVITNTTQLSNMRYFLDLGYYFELGNDIYFDEEEYFEPMTSPNQSVPFNGVFDGKGFSIHNYKVHQETEDVSNAFIDYNNGIIKNVNFINLNVTREHHLRLDGNIAKENLPEANIVNVTVTGYREGGGAGLVGRNYGLIEDITIDIDMLNSNAGLVFINHNFVFYSDVTAHIVITEKRLGYIGGVAGSNVAIENNPAVINFVDADIKIDYGILADNFDDATDIGGFLYMNKGHQSSVSQAMVLSSTIHIEINTLNDHRLNKIGGFVTENSNLGLINFGEATGYIYGSSYLGGFVGINIEGINPGTITNSTADVDVFGQGSRIGGFVGENRGSTVSTPYKARIEYSEAFGNVEGSGSNIGNFAGAQNGSLNETQGHGIVTILED